MSESDERKKRLAEAGQKLVGFAEEKLKGDPMEAVPTAFAAARSAAKKAQEGNWEGVLPELKAALKRPVSESPSYADLAEGAGITSPLGLTAIQTAGDLLEPSGGAPGVRGTIKAAKTLIKGGNAVKFIDEVGRGGPVIQKVGDAAATPAAKAGREQVARQVAAQRKVEAATPVQGARAKAQAHWAEQAAENKANEAARRQFSPELRAAAGSPEKLREIQARMETFKRLFKQYNK